MVRLGLAAIPGLVVRLGLAAIPELVVRLGLAAIPELAVRLGLAAIPAPVVLVGLGGTPALVALLGLVAIPGRVAVLGPPRTVAWMARLARMRVAWVRRSWSPRRPLARRLEAPTAISPYRHLEQSLLLGWVTTTS